LDINKRPLAAPLLPITWWMSDLRHDAPPHPSRREQAHLASPRPLLGAVRAPRHHVGAHPGLERALDHRLSSLWTAARALSGPPRARSRRPPGHAPSLPLQGESRRWSRVPAGRERQVVEAVQAVSMYRQSVLYRQSLCTGSVDCAGSLSEPTSTRACGARPRGTATPTYSRHVSREIRKQALCAQRA
jgi:hypothetical protein